MPAEVVGDWGTDFPWPESDIFKDILDFGDELKMARIGLGTSKKPEEFGVDDDAVEVFGVQGEMVDSSRLARIAPFLAVLCFSDVSRGVDVSGGSRVVLGLLGRRGVGAAFFFRGEERYSSGARTTSSSLSS